MKSKKQIIDENVEYFLREGTLPNGIKPIVMSNVEEYLRSQGDINTKELLEVINKFNIMENGKQGKKNNSRNGSKCYK